MEATAPQVAATALINVSFAWVVGVLTSRLWLMKQTAGWQLTVDKRLSTAMSAGLLVCITGIFLSLWTESAVMGDVTWLEAGPAFAQMLASTHYGHAGAAALAFLVIALLVHLFRRGDVPSVSYLGILTALLLFTAAARVTIGHAYEHGPFSVAVAVEWLHLVVMAFWAGIVFVAGWLVLPRVLAGDSTPTKEIATYLTSMSNWAGGALAGILATGAYNAYRVLGSPSQLIEVDYGQVLTFKLCLVVIAIALGGFNKFVGLSVATSQRGLRTVITILRVESVVLLLVLMAAAVLTSSAPPG
ncbi:copper resistance D family protein [Noviherbaspirillum suwonense]|uniref:Copper resistance protein D n=1 Tax=Noviherbaspirillum suwonense TaxID=1224511 RepID=A0ABY1PXK0_9BURK|nr:CopD family protein [Noviherbaspirillum suwonense]SMP52082.1 putative copper resistance protein D [Noviherbaspirillum suwonense]